MSRFDLSIGDVVARTGVAEPTLRMWERRYGFPEPRRTESGHRRYSEAQAQVLERVLVLRGQGLSLPAAIARARTPPDPDSVSLFSTLRAMSPELEPRGVRKPVLVALSRAIEDEALARAETRVLFGCFQRERFYRSSQLRWRELCAAAAVSAVFADFDRVIQPEVGPVEVPIHQRQHIAREWAIVAYGGRSSICMVGREPASSNAEAATRERSFELLWTVDPEAVRAVARACVVVIGEQLPELTERAEVSLSTDFSVLPAELVGLTTAVLNRTLSELS